MKQVFNNRGIVAALLAAVTVSGLRFHPKEQAPSAASFLAPLSVQRTTILGRREFEPTIHIGVGTPPQVVPMVFDTGSFSPVVFNKTCTAPDCGVALKFNAAKSSSISVSKDQFKASYGAGVTDGKYATDVFSFPSSGVSPALNFTQKFGLVNYVRWDPDQNGSNVNMSGIFGMSLHGNPQYPESDAREIRKQLGIDQYAVWLPRGSPLDPNSSREVFHGKVQFGGYDQLPGATTHHGKLKEPVWSSVSKYFFNYLDDFLVNGKSTGLCNSYKQACGGFIDTGGETMQLYGFGLHKVLPSTPFSCDGPQFQTLPNLTFVINGTHLTLEPRDYVMRFQNGSCENTILTGAYLSEEKDGNAKKLSAGAAETIEKKWNKFHLSGEEEIKEGFDNFVPSSGLFDMGVMWTSRILTIWNSPTNQVGFIQHD